MLKKAKAYWDENKGKIARKIVIYGGIGLGVIAVGYLNAKDEEAKRLAEESPQPDVFVIHENNEDN